MSLMPRRLIEGKHCFVPCPPEVCDCSAGAKRDGGGFSGLPIRTDSEMLLEGLTPTDMMVD